jgi:hypothetical protein
MVDSEAQAELMGSLDRLVRGLSALFWGLPIALVVSVQTCRTGLLAGMGVLPPLVANGLVCYALIQMGRFQPGERVWQRVLDRARVLAVLNVGLSPFLYWLRMMPESLYFRFAVLALGLSGLGLLLTVNQTLRRLAAMLPDETLRLEADLFTTLNLYLLTGTLALGVAWVGLVQYADPPVAVRLLVDIGYRVGLVLMLLLVLLPLALTMALVWKMKETVLASVFASNR